jgi:hypothetical protein
MDFWRQLDIFSPEKAKKVKVTVIGVGGIGSPTVLALAKMGISSITVYDDDKVEIHNLPNQFYRLEDLKQPKVVALAQIVGDYTGDIIQIRDEIYENQPLSDVVISGVDSMSVRKAIWEKIKYNPKVSIYIEARMGAEVARVHTVKPCDPDSVRWYESTLYSDEKAVEAPCSARAIIYCTFMIASLIANQVKRVALAQDYMKEIIFDLVTMTLITN